MRKSKPHEAIRSYLDSHGGSVEVQVDALLATWKVDDLTDEGRATIEQGLAEGGLATRPPLVGLAPEDAITVYVAQPSAPADASGGSSGKARRGGLLSRLGGRSSPPAQEQPPDDLRIAAPPGQTPPEPVAPDTTAPELSAAALPATGSGAAELETLRSERESLRSERDTLRSELERTQREAAEARAEAERGGAEVARLGQAVDTERQKVSQAEGRTSLAGKAEEEAKSQVRSLRAELESARGETASARSEVETARSEAGAARSEVETARKRQQELEDAMARERRPQEELERLRSELASARGKAAELIAGARALVESTTEQLVVRTSAIADLEIRSGDAEVEARSASRELESQRAHLAELEQQVATRQEQEQEAEARVRDERERGAQARAALDAARAEEDRLSGELSSLRAAVAEVQRGLAAGIFESESSDRGASEGKLEELAASEERVGRELARVGPDVSRRQTEFEQAQRRASEVEARLAEVSAGTPELSGLHAQARGRLQALEEEVQSTNAALEGLRKELGEARDGLDSLRLDAERRAAELVEAERRLVEVAPAAEPAPTTEAAPAAAGSDEVVEAPAKRRRFGRRRD